MPLQKPLLPECFLYWTENSDQTDEDILRIVSWRRNLTLRGKSFREFETDVLPLLTGRLSVDDICEKASHVFSRSDILASLEMLASQGILVEGDVVTARNKDNDNTPQLGWLSETAPDGRSAQDRLNAAHVVLFGAGSHGAVAARALVAAGIGKLTIVDPASVAASDIYFSGLFAAADIGTNRAAALASALPQTETTLACHGVRPTDPDAVRALIAGASLVLCCLDSGELSLSLNLNVACRQSGVNWIAGSLEGTELVVGPGFFQGQGGPCYLCWRLREIAGAANPQTRYALETHLANLQTDLSGRRENIAASADIVGGMLASEAFSWLTKSSLANLDGRFLTIATPGFQIEKHVVLRSPGCPVCDAAVAPGA